MGQSEKENSLTEQITHHFMALDESGAGVTPDLFKQGLSSNPMSESFEEIGVDPSESDGIFRLLDTDGSGTLDAAEIIDGLLRLKGPATALELALLSKEVKDLAKSIKTKEWRVIPKFRRMTSSSNSNSNSPEFTRQRSFSRSH